MNEQQRKYAQRLSRQMHEEAEAQRLADPTFLERMNVLIRMCGSASALARAAGVADGTIRKWAAGQSEPTRDRLIALADATRVSITWLVTGEGPMMTTGAEVVTYPLSKGELDPHFYQIPILDTWAKEADLPPDLAPQLDFLAVKIEWAKRYLSLELHDLYIVTMLDESMNPTFKRGSVLIVDTNMVKIKTDGIYLIQLSGEFMVKRLVLGPKEAIGIKSDNLLYSHTVVPKEDRGSIEVWGKVIWSFQKS